MKKFALSVLVLLMGCVGYAQYNLYGSDYSKNITYSVPKITMPAYTSGYTTNINIQYQSGYWKNNGTYVQPHYKTKPNYTNHDNFSTTPNINPFTQTHGTKARDYSTGALNYGSGRTIYTGPKGGQYYINSNGNKTYVLKRW